MKIVSVINYKGGVGKTTLTANLGAYAASKGKRVLMIDLDPQSSLTFSFMTPDYWRNKYFENRTMKNYFDAVIANFIGKSDLRPLIVPLRLGENLFSEGLKLDIICSHLKLIDIDVELASKVNVIKPNIWANSFLETCSYLRNSLSELKDDYDLVLIDCPPNANFVVKNALTASNFCIIPAKMDYLSTLGIHQLKDGINDHINEYNRHREVLKNPPQYPELNIELLGIVPTMVNIISTKNGEKQIISTQQKFMTDLAKDFRILPLVRNNGTIFGTAPVDGIPVVLTRPKFYQVTYKQIISELEELGREFLESINPTQN